MQGHGTILVGLPLLQIQDIPRSQVLDLSHLSGEQLIRSVSRVNPQGKQASIAGTVGQNFLNALDRLFIPNRFHLNGRSRSGMIGILPLRKRPGDRPCT